MSIPVFANGNIQCLEDAYRCIEETGVCGVMCAEGNLTNPAIFQGINPVSWDMAFEYLNIVEQYPITLNYIRGHMFKILHKLLSMPENAELRELMATCHGIESIKNVVQLFKDHYLPYHEGKLAWIPADLSYNLTLPPWICQPYVRLPPEEHKRKLEEINEKPLEKKQFFDNDGNEISRKKAKRLKKMMRRPNFNGVFKEYKERKFDPCTKYECNNPMVG